MIRGAGLGILHGTVHTVIGAVVGLMLSFEKICPAHPAALRIAEMASGLVRAFRGVMVAQAKISAINATLTGIFLLGVMPLLGFQLPLAKSLVLLTFVVGLLPVLGNLISNSAITLLALLVSPVAAAIALVFLVVVHKLEYFLNAKIVGGEIGAKAWELLLAMLVAEASFGVPGLVVAPVTYVWLRDMVVADDAAEAGRPR
jgi:predicted PurR-regulated permease PerM